jgi:Ca2+-binding EF-hand superfamily protein
MRPAVSLALAPMLALAALLCLMRPAGAQTTDADRAKQWFLQHDRDHNGYITLDEVMGYEEKLFKRMDQEGAGRLREDQYCAGIPSTNSVELERCHTRFNKIDANGDAYITLDEIQDFYRIVLQTADQNQDGKVTLAEFMAATAGELP